mgnify:CR=1 FL=1
MPISSHLSLNDLQSLLGVVKQSLAVKTHFDLFTWLQNDFQKPAQTQAAEDHHDDEPSFTEITLDVPDEAARSRVGSR